MDNAIVVDDTFVETNVVDTNEVFGETIFVNNERADENVTSVDGETSIGSVLDAVVTGTVRVVNKYNIQSFSSKFGFPIRLLNKLHSTDCVLCASEDHKKFKATQLASCLHFS